MSNLLDAADLIGGRYLIERYLAEGGMQQVYLALDRSFGRKVVVKAPKNLSASKRFNKSAELSAKVVHPNVAQTLDFIPTAGSQYLIEEFIEGTNLQIAIDTYGIFDPHLAAHILHHAIKGIAASHNAGVIHRDLKPSNIMVSSDPSFSIVKVTDFGIAKMAESEIDEAIIEGEESMTNSSTTVGALPYMAPEVIEDSTQIGPPSDVWAFGAILFHLITGKTPFGKGLRSVPKILAGERDQAIPLINPKEQFSTLLKSLDDIVNSCLKPVPSDRPTSSELAAEFSTLCYSIAERRLGRISKYKQGTGDWGFIRVQGEDDIFFNAASFYGRKIEVGQTVNFAVFKGEPRNRAHPVLPVGLVTT